MMQSWTGSATIASSRDAFDVLNASLIARSMTRAGSISSVFVSIADSAKPRILNFFGEPSMSITRTVVPVN